MMRNVVQVYNKDESMLIGTILAISDYRVSPAAKTLLEFREQPSNARPAVHAWFHPGDNNGREFVYPK